MRKYKALNLNKWHHILSSAFNLAMYCLNEIHAAGSKGRTLSWWCFNPGFAMEEFSQLGVRSIILTSGTLAPLDSFALELKLYDLILANGH
jgi:regulator of telomere elongation helicase 1